MTGVQGTVRNLRDLTSTVTERITTVLMVSPVTVKHILPLRRATGELGAYVRDVRKNDALPTGSPMLRVALSQADQALQDAKVLLLEFERV